MQPYKNYEGGYGRTVQEFGGLNERLRGGEHEFAKMENMSLQEYPALTVRDKRLTVDRRKSEYGKYSELFALSYRGKYLKLIGEFDSDGAMEWNLYINRKRNSGSYLLDINGEMLPKKMIGMGAYTIVLPDKLYFDNNTGYRIENVFNEDVKKTVQASPCTLSGEEYQNKTVGNVAPTNPANGDIWVDTSGETSAYKKWDADLKQWTGVATTYIKLSCEGIGSGFRKWDAVNIPYTPVEWNDETKKLNEQLALVLNFGGLQNNKSTILYDVDTDYLIVSGIIDQPCELYASVERKMPESQFYFEHNNRLWGCVYNDRQNEIRASKQGDCRNWNVYLGISTDSYAATVGVPGEFTGGVSFGGYPLFFKEDCMIKVYGNMPSNYQLITTYCMGVEKGMKDSVVVANGILFYKSPSCFCAYDGSMPVNISTKLQNKKYKDIQAGATDSKVYFACTEENGERYILVFDIERGTWTKEDCGKIECFVRDANVLNFIERDNDGSKGASIKTINGDYDETVIDDKESFPVQEDDVSWSLESCDIGLEDVNLKYIKKLRIRVKVYTGSSFKVFISSDAGEFIQVGEKVITPGVRTVSIPLSLERCESFRYRLEGKGKVDIYSVSFEVKEGSDKR